MSLFSSDNIACFYVSECQNKNSNAKIQIRVNSRTFDALKEVLVGIANIIIRITQITFKFMNNALLIY